MLQCSSISKLVGKKVVEQTPYQVVRWREGVREAGGSCSWLQPHRREKCFAKPEEVIQSHYGMQVFFSLHLAAFAAEIKFQGWSLWGIRALNQLMRPCQVINFIVRIQKKYN